MSEEQTTIEEPDAPKKKKPPIGIIVVALVVVIGLFFGIRMYLYNQAHATTDDAYVTMDVIPVSPRVAGNIVKLYVHENQIVKTGDLLAQLDDTTYQADVDQAKANLAVAEASAQSASVDVGLTSQTAQAQQEQAQGGVAAGASDVGSAQSNVSKAVSEVETAQATLDWAKSQVAAADAAVRSRIADRQRLAQAVTGARAMVTNAQAGVKVAQANLANAQATWTNADKDAKRYRSLANEGAVPVSQAESKETAAANAEAAVEAARQQVEAAQAAVAQRQADLGGAQQQVKGADTAISEARAQAAAARNTISADAARLRESSAGVTVARQGVASAVAHQSQAVGKLRETSTVPKQVSISEANKATAIAKIKQAQAALETAQIALARTRIRAPMDGKISRNTAQIGQQVSVGQPLMNILPIEQPWVVANFKETQIGSIHAGERVEIDVDAVPGHALIGHVDSISGGTGATFALLPADNATGNFTKVVQRVPVKIVFDPGQEGLKKLAAGMSVAVAIDTK